MNRSMFRSNAAPPSTTTNHEGGVAYAMSARHALAQFAVTGCFNATFYVDAPTQLATLLDLCRQVNDAAFVAKVAIYARERSHMKDAPAFLTAYLATLPDAGAELEIAFRRVIDSPKMLSNFVAVVRSGVTGRRSLGTRPKRLVEEWLSNASDEAVFKGSVGAANPSLVDVIRMVHPKPANDARRALYGYLSARNRPEHTVNADILPSLVTQYEAFRAAPGTAEMPDVPFQMLTALPLTAAQWRTIAYNGSWQMVRQSLNAFARHGVFEDAAVTEHVAAQLASRDEIGRARAMPYQLMATYLYADAELVPHAVRDALHDAMEIAVANVPEISGRVVVCTDVSGSMSSPVTGQRKGATTKMRCIDVAALITAAIVRRNPRARVIPFESDVVPASRLQLEPRDSILTNAGQLAAIGGGGTNCSAPLALLNRERAEVDLVIYVSDNESWVDRAPGPGTAMMAEWLLLKKRCPNARMICIDLTPNQTAQVVERPDTVNVGGFSDDVFALIATVAGGETDPEHWTRVIENVALEAS